MVAIAASRTARKPAARRLAEALGPSAGRRSPDRFSGDTDCPSVASTKPHQILPCRLLDGPEPKLLQSLRNPVHGLRVRRFGMEMGSEDRAMSASVLPSGARPSPLLRASL